MHTYVETTRMADKEIRGQTVADRATNELAVVPTVGESTITCVRSLGRREIPSIVVSPSPNVPPSNSRYCRESVVVPSPEENLLEYKEALLSLASRPDVRTIIPMQEADVYVLSRYRSEFEDYVTTPCPPHESLRISQDRVRLVREARAAGVQTPETELLTDVDDWNRELIVKPRYSILTSESLDSASPEYFVEPPSTEYIVPGDEPDQEAIRANMDHIPIVQEYVSGTEYSFWALYDRGTAVATCHKHQLWGDSYAGGVSSYRETTYDPELESVGRALLDHLDWHGLAAVQFLRDDESGEYTLLEINPRVWVSMSCAVEAGADFPFYYWRLAGDEPIPADSQYKLGVGTHNANGEIEYLRSIVTEEFPDYVERPSLATASWEVARALYAQPNFAYVALDDPSPVVLGVANNVVNIARNAGESVSDRLPRPSARQSR